MKLPPIHFASGASEALEFYELLPTLNPDFRPVVLSWGAGFDSTALLLEYILNPARDFPLENLIIIHSVVGGEPARLKWLIENILFPLCRQHNIWVIQCCRNGDLKSDGVTILSSTRQPRTFHLKGSYGLFQHLVKSGTVPQRGGSARLCTLKFKGEVIDAVVAHLLEDSPRQRFIGYNADEKRRSQDKSMVGSDTPPYLIGFNADEEGRKKDRSFGTAVQPYEYLIGFNDDEAVRAKTERNYREQVFRFPLIEMGLGRQWCEQRVNEFAQTEWLKSFCRNGCPFSECNGKRKQNQTKGVNHGDLREDWLIEPHYGGEAAFIERVALAINSEQRLYEKALVLEVLQQTDNQAAIDHYRAMCQNLSQFYPELTANWALYSVRRMFAAAKDGKSRAPAPYRQTQILHRGSEAKCNVALQELAARYGQVAELYELSLRFWSIRRPISSKKQKPLRPYVEECFVVCPAVVEEKQRIGTAEYDSLWLQITGYRPTIRGISDEQTESTVRRTSVRTGKLSARLRG